MCQYHFHWVNPPHSHNSHYLLICNFLCDYRNGTVWRRSLGSGGYRSVKVVWKRAPGKKFAAWGPAAVMTTETEAATVGILSLKPPGLNAAPTVRSLPHLVNVSTCEEISVFNQILCERNAVQMIVLVENLSICQMTQITDINLFSLTMNYFHHPSL